jgi:hypothetical protein
MADLAAFTLSKHITYSFLGLKIVQFLQIKSKIDKYV